MKSSNLQWWVYILVAEQDERTYVGVTVDVTRRLRQHNGELVGGAKSTRPFRPWSLAKTHGPYENRSQAQVVEAQVKRASGRDRIRVEPI